VTTFTPLPRSVVAFLHAHVDHVVKLKFLLVLHGAPGANLSFQRAARDLDVPKAQVRDMANELADDGLVRVSLDRLELSPSSIDDRLAISDLASWYARDRTLVLDVLRAMGRAS
jgi:DNA-binding IclR family transcriptional regulator